MSTKEIEIPKGYYFSKIIDNKIILEKTLPDNWLDCIKYLQSKTPQALEYADEKCKIQYVIKWDWVPSDEDFCVVPEGYASAILALCQLLICRRVYNGEWVPDWVDINTPKYVIQQDTLSTELKTAYCTSHILAFPTEELRNEFYNNFKDLISEAFKLFK